MPNCTADLINFGHLGRRVIEANFQSGAISSDGGLVLLRQINQRIGLSKAVAQVLHDPRDPDRITHSLRILRLLSGFTASVAAMKTSTIMTGYGMIPCYKRRLVKLSHWPAVRPSHVSKIGPRGPTSWH